MKNEEIHEPSQTKKFPVRCIECGQKEVRPATVRKRITKNHDGRLYELDINGLTVTQCSACGSVFFTQATDEQINAALREHLSLLAPAQIKTSIESLDLSQKHAALQLGVAPETLSRWISGAMIQSRALDNLLRGFFACPAFRELLQDNGHTGEIVVRGATQQSDTGALRWRLARFPNLERHGDRDRGAAIGTIIKQRRRIFA